MPDPPTEDDLRAVFELFEADDDGLISLDDMFTGIRGAGFASSNAQLLAIVSECGIGGRCSFEDFRRVAESAKPDVAADKLAEAFRLFDTTNSGTISGGDLEGVLEVWGQKLSKAEVEDFMRLASVNGSSKINYKELCEKLLS